MMLRSLSLPREASRVVKRLSSTQVVTQEKGSTKVSTTKLSNGLTVVTENSDRLNANISLVVKAGSRYENPSTNVGVTHTLRAASCLTSDKTSAFLATQLLGSLGGSIDISASREHISYNLVNGKKIWKNVFYDVVVPTVFGNRFFWWEVSDLNKMMKHQVAQANSDPGFRLMEAVHRASFSGGLSNSVLCSESLIGSHSPDMIKDFFESRFCLDNMVLAGTGVSQAELCEIGQALDNPCKAADTNTPKSRFVASEVREHEPGPLAHVGLSFCGTSLNDQDTIALAVLQNILGTGESVKRGSGVTNRLSGAVGKKVNAPFTVGTYNVNYSDCGVVGIYMEADTNNIAHVVAGVSEEVGSIAEGKLTDEDVNAGKMGLKANVLMSSENAQGSLEDIAVQASLLGGSIPATEIASKVDAVTASQVSRVAKKVLGGKKSLAAVGDITNCPHLCDL